VIITTPSGHRYTVLPDATSLYIDHPDGRPLGAVFLPPAKGGKPLSIESVLALIDRDPFGLVKQADPLP
jgi:hypothetical protein